MGDRVGRGWVTGWGGDNARVGKGWVTGWGRGWDQR